MRAWFSKLYYHKCINTCVVLKGLTYTVGEAVTCTLSDDSWLLWLEVLLFAATAGATAGPEKTIPQKISREGKRENAV